MIRGHGDDSFAYGETIKHDFSSNVITALQPQGLLNHLQQCISLIDHYPQPAAEQLAQDIAGKLGIGSEEVLPTNGATEAIYLVAAAYSGATSAIVEPTFSEYADACRINGHKLQRIATIEECCGDASMLWLCNPNNPTGRLTEKESLLDFAHSHRNMLIVIDQSYEHSTTGETVSAAEAVCHTGIETGFRHCGTTYNKHAGGKKAALVGECACRGSRCVVVQKRRYARHQAIHRGMQVVAKRDKQHQEYRGFGFRHHVFPRKARQTVFH